MEHKGEGGNMKIEIELRQCYVGDKKALFHKWIVSSRESYSLPARNIIIIEGLIEYEDGNLDTVNYGLIKFIDNKHAEYIWDRE
ncbi:hypothetical protein TPELB_23740 [Terrisporobacter petrolearius]|uniref:Uncharacterized protein n=2 Tax=Terrisporobacter petrolearius TaxID=1460447 RepID=A0ABZ3FFS2_9FIRM